VLAGSVAGAAAAAAVAAQIARSSQGVTNTPPAALNMTRHTPGVSPEAPERAGAQAIADAVAAPTITSSSILTGMQSRHSSSSRGGGGGIGTRCSSGRTGRLCSCKASGTKRTIKKLVIGQPSSKRRGGVSGMGTAGGLLPATTTTTTSSSSRQEAMLRQHGRRQVECLQGGAMGPKYPGSPAHHQVLCLIRRALMWHGPRPLPPPIWPPCAVPLLVAVQPAHREVMKQTWVVMGGLGARTLPHRLLPCPSIHTWCRGPRLQAPCSCWRLPRITWCLWPQPTHLREAGPLQL
jgi:hypothetical protein